MGCLGDCPSMSGTTVTKIPFEWTTILGSVKRGGIRCLAV